MKYMRAPTYCWHNENHRISTEIVEFIADMKLNTIWKCSFVILCGIGVYVRVIMSGGCIEMSMGAL
ncbi:hypothetical protein SK3146_06512 [Paenibacillus konkukensis]|uniref:Uncharacterized protein n=1 Tax=Paenibacillus konkukensis TaxID=2020716 RepID=A0ABY4RZT0_9BACL|nr:hypothetical protein SK3146_06512 [Paenibacillus konkukensis]